jgi:glycosyltransferase involved in cell wall biosynthesis
VSVDIVVPTYNNRPELAECLAALEKQTVRDFHVYACVDGSTDGTVEYLRDASFSFPLVVLQHPGGENRGRAATRNLALPRLEAEFVLFLDSDMRLASNALAAHLELLGRRDCASVGDVRYIGTPGALWPRYLTTRGRYRFAPGSDLRPFDFNTANVALRSRHVVAAQGFDETLSNYGGEDTEFAFRLQKQHGLRFVYNTAARALSIERKTVDRALAELREYGAVNLRLIRRYHPDMAGHFWIEKLESNRLTDRAFRAFLNPVLDRIVDTLLPITPFVIQRELLNYKVIRAVFAGYADGPPAEARTVAAPRPVDADG